jgi:hypothetical protein
MAFLFQSAAAGVDNMDAAHQIRTPEEAGMCFPSPLYDPGLGAAAVVVRALLCCYSLGKRNCSFLLFPITRTTHCQHLQLLTSLALLTSI